jgi:hypothetical protein
MAPRRPGRDHDPFDTFLLNPTADLQDAKALLDELA